MGQRWYLLVLITLGACFSPKFNDGVIQCGPDMLCPPGFDCAAGVCRSSDEPIDDAPAGMVTLSVTRSGAGTGGVQSAPVGLDCGATCTRSFPMGTMVTLTAAPLAGSTFAAWSGGACSGSATTCSITLTSNIVVNAEFGVVMRRLTVTAGGNGTGVITSNPAGISCPGVCSIAIPDGAPVVLTASPMGSSTFLGWTAPGTCTGTGTCNFNITADTTVTGSFALDYSVVVTKTGTGTGTVTSTMPAGGINCGGDCNETYPVNTMVTLAAAADGNSTFRSWSGGCTGAGSCVVTTSAAVMVTATFDLVQYPLSVVMAGNGSGTVTSNPSGIMCNGAGGVATGDCSELYTTGTMVTLTAGASLGSTFTGWSHPTCPGTGTCLVNVTMMSGITATFTLEVHQLDIAKAGNGAGVVQTSNFTIDCGSDCRENFNYGSTVVLTATPSTGSVFTSWLAPGCGSLTTCTVTVTAATTVTATFTLTTQPLTVLVTGTGSVSSIPGGIDCGLDCTESYDYNTMVNLVPSPDVGSSFSAWTGACVGSGQCVVTMDQARTVGASFTINTYPLTVVLGGAGAGTVNSNPTGIICNGGPTADCSESYVFNTDVTLTANANAPSNFAGWSGGGCIVNANTCTVKMSSAQTVTALFSPPPNRMFVTSQTFIPGSLMGLAGADAACQAAANALVPPLGGTYRAWLSSSTSNAIARLGSASGWVRMDNRAFANTPTDVANALLYHPPRITETNVDVLESFAVTATTLDGVFNTNDSDCGDYFSALPGLSVGGGLTSAGSHMFTVYGGSQCSQPARLYCFGVDRQAIVIPPPPTTGVRRAFMRLWTPGGGLADADAQCQADAALNNLPGTYLALLPTTTASALSRFSLTGRPWIRVDNVPVLPTAAMWATASYFDSGPNLSADRTFAFGNYAHWAGAANLSSVGTTVTTCTNWTNQAQTGTYGIAGNTKISGFVNNGASITCNFTSATITCLEI